MENSNCPFCTSPSIETKCLLYSIKQKLILLLNDYVPDFNQQEFKQQKNSLSFNQMLKIIFGDKYLSTFSHSKCNHQKVCRYMKRKLKCDSKTFQQLCDHLALKIGERNYNFQVLNTQIKSLGETSIRQLLNEEGRSKKQIGTAQSLQAGDKYTNRGEKLAENQGNQVQRNKNQNMTLVQGINLQMECYYPLGFYYTQFPSNMD